MSVMLPAALQEGSMTVPGLAGSAAPSAPSDGSLPDRAPMLWYTINDRMACYSIALYSIVW